MELTIRNSCSSGLDLCRLSTSRTSTFRDSLLITYPLKIGGYTDCITPPVSLSKRPKRKTRYYGEKGINWSSLKDA